MSEDSSTEISNNKSITRVRVEEINNYKKRRLKAIDDGKSHLQYEMCKGCLVLIDGVTNHEYCESLHTYQKREKELKESLKRKKMMEDILKDHYEPEETRKTLDTSAESEAPPAKKRKMKCMKCSFFTYNLESFKAHEAGGHEDLVTSGKNDSFHIPAFQGFQCFLQGSASRERYYVTEVSQPASSNHDNLSATCYFFLPASVISLNPDLVSQKDVRIPYIRDRYNTYLANFPNTQLRVNWATNRETGEKLVDQRIGFIMTKSRFKIIQSRTNQGKNERLAFCSFIDADKFQLENLVFSQTQSILHSSAPTEQGLCL